MARPRELPEPEPEPGRDGLVLVPALELSSRVPFEQIEQSAVNLLWRQKSEFKGLH